MSIGNINEKRDILFQITSTPNTSENRARDELENNIISCDSPIQLHEADEVPNVNEEKYLGEVDLGTVMHLKKMGSLKNYDKYQISPSKSMPDIPKVWNFNILSNQVFNPLVSPTDYWFDSKNTK